MRRREAATYASAKSAQGFGVVDGQASPQGVLVRIYRRTRGLTRRGPAPWNTQRGNLAIQARRSYDRGLVEPLRALCGVPCIASHQASGLAAAGPSAPNTKKQHTNTGYLARR